MNESGLTQNEYFSTFPYLWERRFAYFDLSIFMGTAFTFFDPSLLMGTMIKE